MQVMLLKGAVSSFQALPNFVLSASLAYVPLRLQRDAKAELYDLPSFQGQALLKDCNDSAIIRASSYPTFPEHGINESQLRLHRQD